MVQKLLFLCAFLCGVSIVQAQETTSKDYAYARKGDHLFNVGVGFPTPANIAATFLSIANVEAKSTPQFTFKYEYGLNDKIGVGLQLGYYSAQTEEVSFSTSQVSDIFDELCCILNPDDPCCNQTVETSGKSTYKTRALSVGARGTLHFVRIEQLDTYSVLSLAYTFINTTENGDENLDFLGSNAPTFEYFAGIGARYYFNENFAVYGEVGNGILNPILVNLGLTWRL